MNSTPTRRRVRRTAPRIVSRPSTFLFLVILSVLCVSAVNLTHAERIALVIGIDNYQSLGKLKVCRNDARSLANVLVSRAGFPKDFVILLTDDAPQVQNRPTYATMRRRIRQVTELARKGDTLLIFFSGHGLQKDGQGYLAPMDGDMEIAIPLRWVRQRLEESAASSKTLILDACHAGAATKGVGGVGDEDRKSVV